MFDVKRTRIRRAGRPSHAAFLLGLFLSLALAAALVDEQHQRGEN